MNKSHDVIAETISTSNPSLRTQAGRRPDKPHQHRYERRKVREYLHIAEMQNEEEQGPSE